MVCAESIFSVKIVLVFFHCVHHHYPPPRWFAECFKHLPFFKCSIAARKMWRCQLQTKVSCGSLWTRGATWYLWPPFARAPGLQGRWKLFHGKGHDVRTFGLQNLGNRPAGSAWKTTLYSAGEFNKVGSFRRCSRKKAELHTELTYTSSTWVISVFRVQGMLTTLIYRIRANTMPLLIRTQSWLEYHPFVYF